MRCLEKEKLIKKMKRDLNLLKKDFDIPCIKIRFVDEIGKANRIFKAYYYPPNTTIYVSKKKVSKKDWADTILHEFTHAYIDLKLVRYVKRQHGLFFWKIMLMLGRKSTPFKNCKFKMTPKQAVKRTEKVCRRKGLLEYL
jgi:hypothetical protein